MSEQHLDEAQAFLVRPRNLVTTTKSISGRIASADRAQAQAAKLLRKNVPKHVSGNPAAHQLLHDLRNSSQPRHRESPGTQLQLQLAADAAQGCDMDQQTWYCSNPAAVREAAKMGERLPRLKPAPI